MTEILTLLLALAGIIALMLAVLYGMKWLNTRVRGASGAGKGMKVVDCIGIGQDKSVMAVKAGKKNLLIGVTSTSITLISELDEEDMALITSPVTTAADMQGKSFAECLKYNIMNVGGGVFGAKTDVHEDSKEDKQ